MLPWGGVFLPEEHLEAHSFIIGSPKSGKTLVLRMLMRAALLDSQDRLRVRALIYDGKREFYPLVIGMGVPAEQIHILLPTDARSVPWDLASDVKTPEDCRTLAEALVPKKGGSEDEKYFANACRAVLASVCRALCQEEKKKWTLKSLIDQLRSKDSIGKALSLTTDGEAVRQAFFIEERNMASMMATIHASVISAYESVAILWENSPHEPISLTGWVKTAASGVLMLMPDLTSASIATINQTMFQWVARLLDAQPDITPEKSAEGHDTWIFLDEFRFAGDMSFLGDLLGKGRSKGIHIASCAQSIEGLVAVYGEHRTYEMINNASNLAVLRMAISPAAEKVAKMFGQHEIWEEDYGNSETKNYKPGFFNWVWESKSKTTSRSVKRVMKDNVLSSTLMGFAPAGPKVGIHGIFSTPAISTWQGPIPWKFVQEWIREKDPDSPAFVPRDADDYRAKDLAPMNPTRLAEATQAPPSNGRLAAAESEQPVPLRSEEP